MPKQAKYIDAFVLVVPKDKVAEYQKMAKDAGAIWLKHGALAYRECIGDDLTPDMGEYTVLRFPEMVKLKDNETVWFSYIEYESKAHRDKVNEKVMADPDMNPDDPDHEKNMPFDMKRMAFGGFEVRVSE